MNEDTKSLLGFIFIILAVGLIVYSGVSSDNEAKRICEETKYFKVVNKDFSNISKNIITDNYRHVLYIERYDNNMKKIDISSTLNINKIEVTEHEYNNFKVGSVYSKKELDIYTYGR